MKILVSISRILVGLLFIFSGWIKLNDPLGMSYKLQEYFSPEVLNLPVFEPYSLMIAIVLVILEVVLGVFLIIGYKPKFTIWSLFILIVFFTFLTFYAWNFDKVKDCGCFGDFLKMTPFQSFMKDVILLIFIVIILIGKSYVTPIFAKLPTTVLALLGFVVSLWFGYHVLMHLPVWDFRAYKIGNNITEGMIVPEDAPKPVLEYSWKFNVSGEEQVIVTDGSYPKTEGEFVSVDTKVLEEGYSPPVVDFSIESDDEDLTEHFLNQENLIVIISYSLDKIESEGAKKLKALSETAEKNGYQVIGLTASSTETKQRINEAYKLGFSWYLCDEKALKTVVRSNPGILELDKGTVMQKVHWNDIEELELPKVERSQVPVEKEPNVVIFIDGKLSTKEELDALNEEEIENMYIYKEQDSVIAYNKRNNTSYDNIIKVELKNKDSIISND